MPFHDLGDLPDVDRRVVVVVTTTLLMSSSFWSAISFRRGRVLPGRASPGPFPSSPIARTLWDCGPQARMSPPTLALDCEIASATICNVTS